MNIIFDYNNSEESSGVNFNAVLAIESLNHPAIDTRYEIFHALEKMLSPSMSIDYLGGFEKSNSIFDHYLVVFSAEITRDLFGKIKTDSKIIKNHIKNNSNTERVKRFFNIVHKNNVSVHVTGEDSPLICPNVKSGKTNIVGGKSDDSSEKDPNNKKTDYLLEAVDILPSDGSDEPNNGELITPPIQTDVFNPSAAIMRHSKINRVVSLNPSGSITVILESGKKVTVSSTAGTQKAINEIIQKIKIRTIDYNKKEFIDPLDLDDDLG